MNRLRHFNVVKSRPGARSQFIYNLSIDDSTFICYTIITKDKKGIEKMSYVELMNEKAKIAAARAELDEQEKKLDERIKLASYSYAQTLFDRMCALGKQIEELGYHVMNEDFNDWIDFGSLHLDD